MKPHEIRALFPINVIITKEMIDSAVYADRNNCIACKALKTVLPTKLHELIDWGTGIGRVDGVAIRSLFVDSEGNKITHYLQSSNTKEGEQIEFIVDKTR